MKVSVFLVCVVKLMMLLLLLCPTIKYWLAMPLAQSQIKALFVYRPGQKCWEGNKTQAFIRGNTVLRFNEKCKYMPVGQHLIWDHV